MDTVDIIVERRADFGKGGARRLRASGWVPGIVYGPKRAALAVRVSTLEFERKLAHLEGTHLVRLSAAGNDPDLHDKVVLVREMQEHPVSGAILHADFYEVDLASRIEVTVPLHFTGKAAGVVTGGILQPVMREIVVECLPTEIPEFIEIDVTPLGIHEAFHVRDVRMPEGVRAVSDAAKTVVTVVAPTMEEAPVAAAAPTEATPGEPAPAEGAAAAKKPESEG
jgi:large subunit ribosomal protein L25